MNRLFIISVISILLFTVSASAQEKPESKKKGKGGFLENTEFNLSSQPNQNGNIAKGLFRYYYLPSFSLMVNFLYETRKDSSDFGDRKDSLIVTSTNDFEANFFVFEYNLSLFSDSLRLKGGVAFNFAYSGRTEEGHFVTSPENPISPDVIPTTTDNQIFDNDAKVLFYSPKIELSVMYKLSFINF